MNIDVKMTYLKYLLLAGAMCAFGSCQREDGPLELPAGNPIELSATSDWPKFTKSLIDDITDLKGDGFVAWGDLTTSNNETITVFDATPVTAIFEDDEVTNWEYSPQQYWQTGTYNFASLLPASGIKDNISIVAYNNTSITLQGGTITLGGYDSEGKPLNGGEQIDLMYALSGKIENIEKDGQPRPDAPVELTFKHLWSQIGFNLVSAEELKGKSINVTQIKLYGSGLCSSINFASGLTISEDITDEDEYLNSILNAISSLGEGATDADTPYAIFSAADPWTVGSEPILLVNGLMVFPVAIIEQNAVYVEVTYGNGKTLTGKINNATWLSGKTYTYTLQIGANSINFSEPKVTDWTTGENFGVDIQ